MGSFQQSGLVAFRALDCSPLQWQIPRQQMHAIAPMGGPAVECSVLTWCDCARWILRLSRVARGGLTQPVLQPLWARRSQLQFPLFDMPTALLHSALLGVRSGCAAMANARGQNNQKQSRNIFAATARMAQCPRSAGLFTVVLRCLSCRAIIRGLHDKSILAFPACLGCCCRGPAILPHPA